MTTRADTVTCPVCAEPADPSHLGCEACGADLYPDSVNPGHWLSSAAESGPCAECGGNATDASGYCQTCGTRQTSTCDRVELDLSSLGAATDFGRRHHYNQDAMAIGRHGDTAVAVVCDGVSSSTFGELAALAAAEAGVTAILHRLETHHPAHDAATAGVTSAAVRAAESGRQFEDNPPSCTYVSGVVTRDEIVITWVGDSRAYWIDSTGVRCLTVDDTHFGRLEAHGVPYEDDRYRTPYAKALLAWLGADAPDLEPNTFAFSPTGPGLLIVCSDGLYGYLGHDSDLANLLPDGPPVHIAAELTQWARQQGGRDNISVAVIRFPSTDPTSDDPQTVRLTYEETTP
ncbi:PP2C family protein-serine/threonine phosphatase [Stackebrandtia soli]|uniref:PP2C family protein-serine/threonine phosphatase n=1 Tax=Stackebrandtia soli TaxID=1892856 RepID=UPI0039E8BB99